MKQVIVFLAIFLASGALMVGIAGALLFAYVSWGDATGVAFAISPLSIAVLLLIVLLLAVFSSWLSRRLLRSRTRGVHNHGQPVS
jgi:hypothetical protein